MAGNVDLVQVIEEWFTLHGLDENFKGSFIAETSSKNEAVIAKDYLEKNCHPELGSRYKYDVEISPRLKKCDTQLTYEISVCLDADY